MNIKNIKEEVTKDMENLRKKNQTETQNTEEGHSSRLEQVKDRISELKNQTETKEKPEEILVKQLKSCERNMQELTNSIKRPNLRITGLKKAWSEIFWAVNENNFNPRILYSAKLSFKIDGPIKIFHDKQKLKQYVTTKPPLQRILQGILHTEDESKQNHKRMESIKPQEKKRQGITE
jgi:hypothetical protein